MNELRNGCPSIAPRILTNPLVSKDLAESLLHASSRVSQATFAADVVRTAHAARFFELLGGKRDGGLGIHQECPTPTWLFLPGLAHYNIFSSRRWHPRSVRSSNTPLWVWLIEGVQE
jgi:hypothetical protein